LLTTTHSNKTLRFFLLAVLTLLLVAMPMGAAFAQDSSSDEGAGIVGGIFGLICGGIIFIVAIASVVWVYRDANARGANGCLWALVAWFIFWPFSLLLYILLRPKA
jgi:hypothetical protein